MIINSNNKVYNINFNFRHPNLVPYYIDNSQDQLYSLKKYIIIDRTMVEWIKFVFF